MIRKPFVWVLAAALAAAFSWAIVAKPVFDWMAPAQIERAVSAQRVPGRLVVLFSIDGLATRILASTPTPFLDRLAEQGRVAKTAYTIFPGSTLPAHTSMLSGVAPEVHAVRFNRYQPWSRVEVETVFSVCRKSSLRCGLFAGKAKFSHFSEFETGVERYRWQRDSQLILESARSYILSRSPNFVMIHLPEIDRAGHSSGWGSEVQRAALERIDALLGAFVEAVEARAQRPLAVIVTADHGGHDTGHGTSQPEDLLVPWLAWGDGVDPGSVAGRVEIADTAPSVLSLLGIEAPSRWTGVDRLRE
jgi:hypothetical protein